MPLDEHNKRLLNEVHPEDWHPPKPEPVYNLVVIGAGTAGLIASIGCAALGGKVALVERHLMGGDCLNTGCVPSKSLIRSSRAAAETASANRFGLTPHQTAASDFPAVMERLRRLRARISRSDSARRYSELGVHVFFGEASFADRQSIMVDGIPLRFRKAVIATGASPVHPDIKGLADAGFRTNETIFDLAELPSRLAVIGGGPVGCELAQAFRRLGSEVTILQNTRFLPREDAEASAILEEKFIREGIEVQPEANVIRVEKAGGRKRITADTRDGKRIIEVDEILVGAGRRPNIESLSLSNAGVDFDTVKGIRVNDFLSTTNPRIYAAGDVCMNWKFTHAADAAARIVVQNALFLGRKRLSALNMPWCTYTDPEIAHIGLYEEDARARNIDTDTYRVALDEVDRAVVDGETEGFVKILVRRGTDRIVGATIVAAHAGDLISQVSVAMAGNIGLKTLADVIYPYPTQTEAIRRVAAAYNRTRLTQRVSALLRWWLKYQRRK